MGVPTFCWMLPRLGALRREEQNLSEWGVRASFLGERVCLCEKN